MKNIQALKELAIHAVNGTVPADATENFSAIDVNESFRKEIEVLASDYNQYRRNKLDIFEIIQTAIDHAVPNRVIDIMGRFAEVRQVPHGTRVSFKRKVGKNRAKQFITRVGVAGTYETFRLDAATYDIEPRAYGGAGLIDFERFICGDESLADIMDIVIEGLVDSVFLEVQEALKASVSVLRPSNTVYSTTYDGDKLFKLINTVRAYGTNAVVFASPEFVASMGADGVTVGSANWAHSQDMTDIHDTGYVTIFRGAPIVRFPQSFTDETNATKVIDPAYAYVFPTGGEKVVKVVVEGDAIVDEYVNRADKSMEIQAYKKFGVGIATYYNWGVYYNAALS